MYWIESSLHTPKGTQGQWQGSLNHTLPSYSQVHPRSHQPIPGAVPTSPEEQQPKGRWGNTNDGLRRRNGCPRRASAPPQPGETSMPGSQLWNTFGREVVSASGYGAGMGCRERVFWICPRLTVAYLGGEPKAGKRKDLDDSWRNKCGKTEA